MRPACQEQARRLATNRPCDFVETADSIFAGESKVAEAIDKAVHQALASKQIKSLAAGKMGMGTREVGDLIAKLVS